MISMSEIQQMSRDAYERGKLEGAGLRDAWKSAAKRWRRSYQALAQRVDSHWDRWPDIVAELRAEGAAEERERFDALLEAEMNARAGSRWPEDSAIILVCHELREAIRNAEEGDDASGEGA